MPDSQGAPVLLDFESRSRADLKKLGGRLYWEHASTEALCCAWHDTADDSRGVWLPGEPWPHGGRILVAHNAKHFDQFGGRKYGFAPAGWIDSSDLARKSGLPGALEELGVRIGYPKDKVASKFTKGLSSVRRPPKKSPFYISPEDWKRLSKDEQRACGVQPELTAEAMDRVVTYCERDVEIMSRGWDELSGYLEVDAEACWLDGVVNERGICVDRQLLQRMIEIEDERFDRVVRSVAVAEAGTSDEIAEIEADLRSFATRPKDIAEILGLASGDKEALAPYSWHPLVQVRQAAASIIKGKALAGLARTSADGRMRDTLQYYGGHTGRWSGRGMQLHNLTRPVGKDADGKPRDEYDDDDVCRLVDAVLAGGWAEPGDMPVLLRGSVCAATGKRLVVADFSSVEARATCWAAGDEPGLDVYRQGLDAYKAAASDIYGVPYGQVEKWQRQIGKVAVLALGYQGGPGAFENMATGTYGIDTSGLDVPDIVRRWRDKHQPIVRLWYSCQRAFVKAAAEGRASWAGPFEFVPADDGQDVAVYLPNGRPLIYRDARAHRDYDGRWSCSHFGQVKPGRWGIVHTYGGKLVENLIQAMCREAMAEAMCGAERRGLPVVLTVHDEVLAEVGADAAADAYDELCHIMSVAPAWAAGFPFGASGFHGRRYRK